MSSESSLAACASGWKFSAVGRNKPTETNNDNIRALMMGIGFRGI